MFDTHKQAVEFWTEPAREVFNFWISFSPMAPFFGVEWRFGEVSAQFTSELATGSKKAADTVLDATGTIVETAAVSVTEVMEKATAAEPLDVPAKAVETDIAEPVAVLAEPEQEADAEPEPVLLSAPDGLMTDAPNDPDDLTELNGVGPALAKKLNGLGVYQFEQIASFSDDDLAWVDENLGGVKGRCFRDNWVGQAKSRLV